VQQEKTGQPVQAPNINSQAPENILKVAAVVHQIMTESNGAVSEEDKIVAITKKCLNTHEAKCPLEFIGPSKS
jgi:hypothetical protein